jgi:proline iminopeptidase
MAKYNLFPEIEPYNGAYLRVSDLHEVFYEEVGNPKGKPVIFLHGGPGVGILPNYRRFFDPAFYRVILLDQRGAGRSKPHSELRENTTWDIVDDLEKLKNHLKIDKWLLFGGSWGSTLALSYAITYPQSVFGIIIRGVFLGRQFEIDWLDKNGMNQIYPDEWERFQAPIPAEERDDMPSAYLKILTGGNNEKRLAAARAWSRWEGATMNLFPNQDAINDFSDAETALSIAMIECQYAVNRFYMPSDIYLLEHAGVIKNIPLRIVQGRYDVICPVISAWELHKAIPKSELVIVPDGSHSPLDPGMVNELVRGTEDFKRLVK